MDEDIRREIIMEHYREPENKHRTQDETYEFVNTNNSSCIDNLDIFVKIEDNIIKDICFDGEACAISTSSTSIMIHMLIGKTLEEARVYLKNYEAMINEEPYDKELLGELNAYDEIYLQPNRKKCALLPFESLKRVLNENDENNMKIG